MKIKAPLNHGTWLVYPKPESYSDILIHNKNIMRNYPHDISSIRSLFRFESGFDNRDCPVIMTGHQPEWFHPGVWSKNFLTHRIASACDGFAVNCVIDSDNPKNLAWTITKPTDCKYPENPLSIPFIPSGEKNVPWELQKSLSYSFLHYSFSEIIKAYNSQGYDPMATIALKQVSEVDRPVNAARQFSIIRNNVEMIFGLKLLDFFISDISMSKSFIKFIRILFLEIEVAFDQYNRAIAAFKVEHEITHPKRPIPVLKKDNNWFETPLWIFSNNFPERSRFWIKFNGDSIDWRSDHAALHGFFPFQDLDSLSSCFRNLASNGIFIRPRALLISLFLRVIASDLFIHGLGGTLYDEMTDRWIMGWLRITPPVSMVCSATFRLPFIQSNHSRVEINNLKAALRDIFWHGESIVDPHSSCGNLYFLRSEKSKLIEWNPHDKYGKNARCKALRVVNKKISGHQSAKIASIYEILDHQVEWIREEKALSSREIPWIMHPVHEIETVMNRLMDEIRI